MNTQTKRITSLLAILNDGLYEREEVIAVSLLAALAGQNIFLYGPPGTAKSLISRRLSKVFQSNSYFEHLMQRFSTPEEVFGPISISELKKDNYVRKIDGFLPKADFVFLDEIWKSSPAILNTLLTIINERIFKNGTEIFHVPLKVLISASNETPPENQGLDALFDRFLVRLNVPPVYDKKNFESILQNGSSEQTLNVPDELKITNGELVEWQKEINAIKLSEDTFKIIDVIRIEIDERNKKNTEDPFIYVSDRRWQRAAYLMKASAMFCGREETNMADCMLLPHCLWTKENNRQAVADIVETAIREHGFSTNASLEQLESRREELEDAINDILYYDKDEYKTVTLADGLEYFEYFDKFPEEYYQGPNDTINFFIPVGYLKSGAKFFGIDINGNEHNNIECQFNKNGECTIHVKMQQRWNHAGFLSTFTMTLKPFRPELIARKGDKKPLDIKQSAVLAERAARLAEDFNSALIEVEAKRDKLLKTIETPFLSKDRINIVLEGIDRQLEDIAIGLKDCDRLKAAVTF